MSCVLSAFAKCNGCIIYEGIVNNYFVLSKHDKYRNNDIFIIINDKL